MNDDAAPLDVVRTPDSTTAGGGRPRLYPNVVPGVHRLEHAYVNCYLLEEGGALTIVDTAHPATWRVVQRAIEALGRGTTDVRACVLTHAHFDHLGFARNAMREWGVPVFAHEKEEYIAAHPYRYAHENSRAIYPIKHPKGIPALVSMTRAGALVVKGIEGTTRMTPAETLDVPGHPVVVFTPGHTYGHCALHLPGADAVLSGDALVTFNPYTGGTGCQIVSGAATADSAQALASLSLLAQTGARVMLPGHGEVWWEGSAEAARIATAAGPS